MVVVANGLLHAASQRGSVDRLRIMRSAAYGSFSFYSAEGGSDWFLFFGTNAISWFEPLVVDIGLHPTGVSSSVGHAARFDDYNLLW
jgi:hypothetical protein